MTPGRQPPRRRPDRRRDEIPGATIIFWLPLLVFLAAYAAFILIRDCL